MLHPMIYTLGQAAKATGKAKGTISNAVKQGRLSASKNDKGEYEIDASELHRVYPLNGSTVEQPSKMNDVSPPLAQAERDAFEARIALLEQGIERERQNADEWRKQAQNLALTYKRPRGWLDRLLGRKKS